MSFIFASNFAVPVSESGGKRIIPGNNGLAGYYSNLVLANLQSFTFSCEDYCYRIIDACSVIKSDAEVTAAQFNDVISCIMTCNNLVNQGTWSLGRYGACVLYTFASLCCIYHIYENIYVLLIISLCYILPYMHIYL